MFIYVILYIYIIGLSIIFYFLNNSKKNKIVYLLLCFIPMTAIMAFRGSSIGTDTSHYITAFLEIVNNNSFKSVWNERFVFNIICKFIGLFSKEPEAYIVGTSVVINLLIFSFVGLYSNKNYSVILPLYLLFNHYLNSFNISRQYIALGFVLLFYYFIINKKLLPAVIFITLAIFTHNTSILALLVLPMFFIKKTNIKFVILYSIVLGVIIGLYPKFLKIFASLFEHYDMYLDGTNDFVGQNRKIVITAIYAALAIFYLFVRKNINPERYKKLDFMLILIICAVLIGIFALKSVLLTRIEYYFSIIVIIFIPELLNCFGKRDALICILLIFAIMSIPFFVQLNGNINGVRDYITWFN